MRREHLFEAALAAQRVSARGELGVLHAGGRTRIDRLYQEGAAKIRMPRTVGDPLEAVLINTAGGLTGGDRLGWSVIVGEDASATVTTQTCEKIYRAASGIAKIDCRMTVGAGGRLAWLPQETIVFDNSAFRRTIEIELAAEAQALIVEATVFGRRAMGELVERADFTDRWRIRRGGRLVHAEDFSVGPNAGGQLAAPTALGDATCVATVLVLSSDAEQQLDAARGVLGDGGGAASAWTVAGSGKLLARLTAKDSYELRKRLIPLIELLNGRAGLPKVWTL
jgi:urease accessory protein